MDPNKPTDPTTLTPPSEPVAPQGAATPSLTPPPASVDSGLPATPLVTQASGGSKKPLMMIIIVVLIVAILGVGGYMFYQSQMGAQSPDESTTTPPADDGLNELNTEIDSIQVTDPNAEFVEVDSEINSLDATASGNASPSARTSPPL